MVGLIISSRITWVPPDLYYDCPCANEAILNIMGKYIKRMHPELMVKPQKDKALPNVTTYFIGYTPYPCSF